MIWVINANSVICKIYEYDKNHALIKLIKEITHPIAKNLSSDKPGHYQVNAAAGGAYQPHMLPKQVEMDHFAKEIADELNHGRNANAYEKLIIIMSPHLNGLFAQHLNKHVKTMIINNIKKNIEHMTQHELIDFLKIHAQYPDS